MRRFIKYLFGCLVIMIIITYALGWIDLIGNNMLTGNWGKDIIKSFTYYFKWVLPYWWLIIIGGTVVLFMLSWGLQFIVDKIRN